MVWFFYYILFLHAIYYNLENQVKYEVEANVYIRLCNRNNMFSFNVKFAIHMKIDIYAAINN